MTEWDQAAEQNRRIIQDAIDAALPGETVNTDKLPLIRVDGKTPVAQIFKVPRSAAILWKEAHCPARSDDT